MLYNSGRRTAIGSFPSGANAVGGIFGVDCPTVGVGEVRALDFLFEEASVDSTYKARFLSTLPDVGSFGSRGTLGKGRTA